MANRHIFSSVFIVVCLLLSAVKPMPTQPKHNITSEEDREQTVYEGETIEISCVAVGLTTPVFHWLHNGVFLEQGPLDLIANNIVAPPPTTFEHWIAVYVRSTLVLRNVNRQHSGKYTCVADTTENRVVETFTVNVLPKDSYKPTGDKEAVRIYQRSFETSQIEGEDVHLLCRTTQGITRSAPVIRWTLNGEELDPLDKNYKIYRNGDLRVTRLTREHHGETLECTAFGDHGTTDSYKPYIYVYEKAESRR